MSTPLPGLDAVDYAAGRGAPDQTAAFDARLLHEPDLAEEVALWRRLHPALVSGDPPVAPDQSAAILRRAQLERRAPRPLATPRWVLPVAAAATLVAGVGGFWAGTQRDGGTPASSYEDPVAYTEDGSAILPPPDHVALARYLPLASETGVETATPRTLPDSSRPWIGLWTRPARLLVHGEDQRKAHMVLRVVGGSPAWLAGLRPGDMLLNINGCSLQTPVCLAHALEKCAPGDTVPITYWSGHAGRIQDTTVTLESVHE